MGRHTAPEPPTASVAGRGRRRLAEPGAAVLLVFADGSEAAVQDEAVLVEADQLLGALTAYSPWARGSTGAGQ